MLFCDTVKTNGGSIGLKRDKRNRMTRRPLWMDDHVFAFKIAASTGVEIIDLTHINDSINKQMIQLI